MASGKAERLDGPEVPPTMIEASAAGDPAAQGGQLVAIEAGGVHVLPDQPVERTPRLDPRWQIGDVEAQRERSDVVLVRQEVEVADDPARALGHDAHHHLRRVVDREGRGGRRDRRGAIDQADLDLTAEARRLRVQAMGLVRLGRDVDHGAEPRPTLDAARHPELADDGRPIVLEADVDGHPGTDAGVAIEQDRGLHRKAGRRRDRGERCLAGRHRPGHKRGQQPDGRDDTRAGAIARGPS